MMIRPIVRISSGPNPRDVVGRELIRIPDAVFGGSVSENRIAFLLTVIPISSSRVLCFLAGHAEGRHVDEQEVVVGPTRDDTGTEAGERLGDDPGVLDVHP